MGPVLFSAPDLFYPMNMKNTLFFFVVSTFFASSYAQVRDTSFGVPESLYPNINLYYAVTACDFDGRRDQAFSALHLPDGRIVLAGNSAGAEGNDIAIARLMSDGQYDPSLGPDGQLRLNLGIDNDTCLTAVLYGEDHILLAGGIAPAGTDFYHLLILRTDLEGNPDTTFGNGGQVNIELPSYRELVTELRTLPDGRIIVAGNALGLGENIESSVGGQAFICRLLENGSVDTTFGDGGFIYRHWESDCETALLGDLSIDGSGRIVITGAVYDFFIGLYDGYEWCDNHIVVCRYTPDGQVDTTFGTNGAVLLGEGGKGSSLLHYEDGRIFFSGLLGLDGHSGPVFAYFARLMPDGTLDTSFSGDGKLRSLALMSNVLEAGVVEPFGALRLPGRIIVGSLMGINYSHTGFGALALTENGLIDSTFAENGIFSFMYDTAPRVYINEITSTGPDHFFLSGYYRTNLPSNMLIGKVRMPPSPPSGTAEQANSYGRLAVYPNPVVAGQRVMIEIEDAVSTAQEQLLLMVRDLHGRVVFQQVCPEQADMLVMGTSGLIPGIYTIELCGRSTPHVGRLMVVGQ